MRVNIGTIEVSDNELYGIALRETGEMRKATRHEVKGLLVTLVESYMEGAGVEVAEMRAKFDCDSSE